MNFRTTRTIEHNDYFDNRYNLVCKIIQYNNKYYIEDFYLWNQWSVNIDLKPKHNRDKKQSETFFNSPAHAISFAIKRAKLYSKNYPNKGQGVPKPKLENCPFCGGEIKVLENSKNYGEEFYTQCSKCNRIFARSSIESYLYKKHIDEIKRIKEDIRKAKQILKFYKTEDNKSDMI